MFLYENSNHSCDLLPRRRHRRQQLARRLISSQQAASTAGVESARSLPSHSLRTAPATRSTSIGVRRSGQRPWRASTSVFFAHPRPRCRRGNIDLHLKKKKFTHQQSCHLVPEPGVGSCSSGPDRRTYGWAAAPAPSLSVRSMAAGCQFSPSSSPTVKRGSRFLPRIFFARTPELCYRICRSEQKSLPHSSASHRICLLGEIAFRFLLQKND